MLPGLGRKVVLTAGLGVLSVVAGKTLHQAPLAALAVPKSALSRCKSHMSGTEIKGPLILT